MSGPDVIRTLVVDPTREIAERIAAALGEADDGASVSVSRVESVAAAAERMARREAEVVVLPLPGPEGSVRRIVELRAGAPDAPIVVLTAAADEPLALKAVQLGATDFLVLERLYGTLLVRCLRHAVELETVRARLREYEAHWPPVLALEAEGREGPPPLRSARPGDFAELTAGYGRMLDRAVGRVLGGAGREPDPEACRLARRAGELGAGPRDLVEIHQAAMQAQARELGALRMKLYVAEGRVSLLELMGHLASHYRDALPGAGATDVDAGAEEAEETDER